MEAEEFLSLNMAKDDQKTTRDTARYIFDMSRNMRQMAVEARLDFLTHLLDMVAEEAKLASEEKPKRRKQKRD